MALHPFLQPITTVVLRKDIPDATPFALGVASATTMTDAVRKTDLVGGLLRPYRFFKALGPTATAATVHTGQDATIMPVLDGQVYSITALRLKTLATPNLNTTITIKAGVTTIWTAQILLAGLPAVGKILDILTLGTTLPADVVLPAVLTVTASSGTFELLVDGVLL